MVGRAHGCYEDEARVLQEFHLLQEHRDGDEFPPALAQVSRPGPRRLRVRIPGSPERPDRGFGGPQKGRRISQRNCCVIQGSTPLRACGTYPIVLSLWFRPMLEVDN